MGFKRFATAHWQGDLKSGKGAMSTPQSGLFAEQNYSFNTRFGEEKGTNPEELLAAAHAGCYSMALGFILQNAGFTATRIDTRAEVLMETSPGPHAVGVHLIVSATVPGIDAAGFAAIADTAKANCVISKALAIPVTMNATLV
ncbi:MAG TPA: OsmC family protein [Arenimonas sp.]|uniref:OsmC family protein n=1 Tax=Arenimonas sp. TaxID=1872635 RepID=UPI002BC8EEE5|nr:OsmC family protein [Arenimonas sp.]HMB57660.1 OsmC family protein [Arenimonas sp.]